ncbi:MAG: DNA repair protein RadA [Chloracidobacterium sp.]|uniref:DNA repair protein RadA n=1 Tax=Chloracidobacterium validum TaxID=2821543 RepID=A0ABX8B9Q2_9BACT|nr:DNA repair protein RadA [Chloracidobacterium validum]QUW02399.1 DNA repair protein RadA [Chloracidobacterium validum]
MPKEKTIYACQQCSYQSRKWLGRCPDCGAWNTFVEEREEKTISAAAVARSLGGAKPGARATTRVAPTHYAQVPSQDDARFSSGMAELDRVLGGGIVPGSLLLIGGDPGVGKSTLLLQMAAGLSCAGERVLYVSGEESERQIKLRGERLGLQPGDLHLLPETCLERVLEVVAELRPTLIVVDSVQTTYSERLDSAPGSVSQVRETAGQCLLLAKHQGVPVFLIGHVTKDGALAGPKTLEHIVDTVIYFEGERHHNHRIMRATKNRFGATNELGLFEMTGLGLVPVANPSALFLQQRPVGVAGSVVVACMEGTRPMLVELQALVSSSKYGTGRRTVEGVEPNRVALLIAMLEKRAGLQMLGDDVFVNVAGGLTLDEPAVDLGIVAALASSFRNTAIDPATVVFGEVGLAGEVRATSQPAVRLREIAAMGFERVVMPAGNLPGLELPEGLSVVGVRSVLDALDALF